MSKLELIDVSRTFESGAQKVVALKNVTLSINQGEILAILGLNGAGKTTLVKILAGLISQDSGSIGLDGIEKTRSSEYLKRIGAVFEGNRNIFWRLTVYENLEYFGVLRGLSIREAKREAHTVAAALGLKDKERSISAHLSRGMQQRLAIGISLIHRPTILVLDEPTLGVDIENVLQIVDILKGLAKAGTTIILTSHQMDIVKMLADRIAVLVSGSLVALETSKQFLAHTQHSNYLLAIEGNLDEDRKERLLSIGVIFEDSNVLKFESELFYSVIDVLRPLRIKSLHSDEEDFTSIFLKHTKGLHDV